MSVRITTALIVLLILFAVAGTAYVVDSQKEISTLKQRVVELSQELTKTQMQHNRLQEKHADNQSSSIGNTPPLESSVTVTVPDADTSVSDEDDPLKQAVLDGDVKALHSLIKSGADLSSSYADGQSLLHLAAWTNDADVVAFLI